MTDQTLLTTPRGNAKVCAVCILAKNSPEVDTLLRRLDLSYAQKDRLLRKTVPDAHIPKTSVSHHLMNGHSVPNPDHLRKPVSRKHVLETLKRTALDRLKNDPSLITDKQIPKLLLDIAKAEQQEEAIALKKQEKKDVFGNAMVEALYSVGAEEDDVPLTEEEALATVAITESEEHADD